MRTGLVLAVPAIMKFQFMKPPKKAAIAVFIYQISARYEQLIVPQFVFLSGAVQT
jgi:hypothetical protein